MSSTHSFHIRKPIRATWWTGKSHAACATLEFDDCRIDLFAHGDDMRDRVKRAIEAFAEEMQRETVAQAEVVE